MIKHGRTGCIIQLISFARGACTRQTVFDVYKKVCCTRLSCTGICAVSKQSIKIIQAHFFIMTTAVDSIDNFCIVLVLEVLYLNTQKPLRAGHLDKNSSKQRLIFTTLYTHSRKHPHILLENCNRTS